MDRGAREKNRDRTFNEMLREKLKANNPRATLEDLVGRNRETEASPHEDAE
jgi:hypothetical protein